MDPAEKKLSNTNCEAVCVILVILHGWKRLSANQIREPELTVVYIFLTFAEFNINISFFSLKTGKKNHEINHESHSIYQYKITFFFFWLFSCFVLFVCLFVNITIS